MKELYWFLAKSVPRTHQQYFSQLVIRMLKKKVRSHGYILVF